VTEVGEIYQNELMLSNSKETIVNVVGHVYFNCVYSSISIIRSTNEKNI